jgi:hypothetical protein
MLPSGHRVSDERLEEFRKIYNKAYGEEITVEEAREMSGRLIALYRLLMQPLPKSNDEVSSSSSSPSSPAQTAPEES